MQSLSTFTLSDPEVVRDPYPYYERLRAEDPVHFDEGIQTWLVTRHEDIVMAARNTEVFSDEMRASSSIRSSFKAEVDEYMRREGFLPLGQGEGFKVDGEQTRIWSMIAQCRYQSWLSVMRWVYRWIASLR